jgi:hypothetical protein
MLKRVAAVMAVAAGTLLGAQAGPASAASAALAVGEPEVAWVNQNIILSPDQSSATVLGKYRCSGGETGTHLWVSVKQGPALDAEHTTSEFASAWYDTNYNYATDPAGLTVDCDGHWHVSRITVKPVFGTLTAGSAYVQWCLYDSVGGFAGPSSFLTVRAGG